MFQPGTDRRLLSQIACAVLLSAVIAVTACAPQPAPPPTSSPTVGKTFPTQVSLVPTVPPAAATVAPAVPTPTAAAPAATTAATQAATAAAPAKGPASTATAPPAAPTAAPAAAPAPTRPAGGNPTAGQATFNANCNACHPNGQAGVGPTLVGLASQKSDAEIGQVIRAGKGMMPPFPGDRIGDQQLADLLAYLKMLR